MNVEVHVRVRPSSSEEATLTLSDKEVTMGPKCLAFDRVYNESATQADIYEEAVAPLVEGVLEGYNGTIFAYGQTGSGKSYTMGTEAFNSPSKAGIVPRALAEILSRLKRHRPDASVKLSFIEIYKEELRDLLSDSTRKLYVREGSEGQVFVSGATEVDAKNIDEVYKILTQGNGNRATEGTQLNEASSRSHAILTATIESRRALWVDETSLSASRQVCVVRSKLHCVDLAGSERARRSHGIGQRVFEKKTADDRFKEGIHINAGLLALGKVISALCDKNIHVPYRESKLTRVLQDSLGGRARTVMIACVSPDVADTHETSTTLSYASRARHIQNRVSQNRAVVLETPLRNVSEAIPLPPPVLPSSSEKNLRIAELEAALSDARADLERDEDIFLAKSAEAKRQAERALASEAAFAAVQRQAQLLAGKKRKEVLQQKGGALEEEEAATRGHLTRLNRLERDIAHKEDCIRELAKSEEEARQCLAAYRRRVEELERSEQLLMSQSTQRRTASELGGLRNQEIDLKQLEDLREASERRHAVLVDEAASLRQERDKAKVALLASEALQAELRTAADARQAKTDEDISDAHLRLAAEKQTTARQAARLKFFEATELQLRKDIEDLRRQHQSGPLSSQKKNKKQQRERTREPEEDDDDSEEEEALLEKRAARWLKRRVEEVVALARDHATLAAALEKRRTLLQEDQDPERKKTRLEKAESSVIEARAHIKAHLHRADSSQKGLPTPYDALSQFREDLAVLPRRRASAVLLEASRQVVALSVAREEDHAALARLKALTHQLKTDKRTLKQRLLDTQLLLAATTPNNKDYDTNKQISCVLQKALPPQEQ